MKNRIIPFLSVFLLLIAFIAPTSSARANSADQKIKLVASPNFKAKGSAKFRDRRHEQELEVEVELSRRSAGIVLNVVVDEVVVGQITLDKNGEGELSLNSEDGDTVPTIHAGSTIAVVNAAGDIILAGQF